MDHQEGLEDLLRRKLGKSVAARVTERQLEYLVAEMYDTEEMLANIRRQDLPHEVFPDGLRRKFEIAFEEPQSGRRRSPRLPDACAKPFFAVASCSPSFVTSFSFQDGPSANSARA